MTLAALFAAGFIGIFGYTRLMRPEVAQPVTAEPLTVAPVVAAAAAAQPSPQADTPAEQPVSAPSAETSAADTPSAEKMAQWAVDAKGDDSSKRVAAIAALANVPKAQALPVLQGVLISGDREVDRPLALRSLRTLAERQGDEDGRIRDAIRHAIYHGDDEATTQAAQDALGQVESELAMPKARPRTRG
jgi:hypothetical protein